MTSGSVRCSRCGAVVGLFGGRCPSCEYEPELEADELLGPGTVLLGRFEVVEKLGAGGMGMVYRAVQQPLGVEVCIKTLHRSLIGDDPTFAARFEREARVLASLRHPNIVSILDFGDDPRAGRFFVMELVSGEDLRTVLKREGPMSAERAVRILGQVCDALTEAHGKGVVHRDLKPSNVMVRAVPGRPDFVKVLDFGSALVLGDDPRERLTRAGNVIGTPIYMAPEYILGRQIDGRADVYAVGVVLYYLLCGSPPFKGVAQVLFAQHVGERPPSPRVRNPQADLPPRLETVLMRALEKDPALRWGSAAALKAAMDAALVPEPARPAAGARGAGAEPGLEWDESLLLPGPEVAPPESAPEVRRAPEPLAFVGREAELEVLVNLARGARRGRVFLLSGTEGVGKSRLVQEVGPHAERLGVHWTVVAATPRAYRGLGHPATRLSAQGGAGRDDSVLTGTLVDRIAGVVEVTGQTGLIGRAAQDRLVGAAVDWLADKLGESPVVVVLDDLEEADDLTLALARRLIEVGPGLGASVVLVARDPSLLPLKLPGDASRMHLGPIGAEQARSLARAALGASADEAAVLELASLGLGVPALVEALAGPVLARDRAVLDPCSGLQPGQVLRHLVGSRLGALGPAARRVLSAAAVLGYGCSEREALETAGEGSSRALEEALASGLVGAEAGAVLRFPSPSGWRAVLAAIPAEQRRELHASAARTIGSRDPDRAAELGEHLFEAGAHQAALGELRRGAARAEAEGELRAAAYCYRLGIEAALSLGPAALETRIQLHRELGRLQLELGELRSADAMLAAAAEQAAVAGLGSLESDLARLRGRAAVLAGDLDTGRRRLEEALRLASERDAPAAAARAAADLADTDERMNRSAAATAVLRVGLELVGDATDDEALRARVRLLKRLGRLEAKSRNHEAAVALLDEALALAQRTGDRYEAAGILGNLGSAHARLGDGPRALELTERARRQSAELGDMVGASRQTYNLALIHLRSGRVELARDLLGRSRAVAERTGWREGVRMCDSALQRLQPPDQG